MPELLQVGFNLKEQMSEMWAQILITWGQSHYV
jgi:hypothetical protein